MPQSLNEELLDAVVRHQIYLQRYSTSVVRKIIKLLNKTDADIVSQILEKDPLNQNGTWSARRLKALLNAIRGINRDAFNRVENAVRSELTAAAAYEADFSARMITLNLPVEFNIVQPSEELLATVVTKNPIHGQLIGGWVDHLSNSRIRSIEQQLRIGLVEGETIDQLVRRLRGTKARQYRDGVLDLGRRHAESFVRTAVNHATTQAREALYGHNRDLIKKVKWVSTLDSRTTPICRARDGKLFEVDKGPRPPAHPGCRSTTVPIVPSWRELGFDLDELDPGTRASMNGQVPADLTYGPWLKRQPTEFVEDVLGKTKAKLFLKGELPIDRFVDDRGFELTLDQLRQREAAAFAKAGL